MKKASNIICWIEGIIGTVVAVISTIIGIDLPVVYCSTRGCYTVIKHQPSPWWAWLILIIGLIIRLVILLTRPSMLDEGRKVKAGVLSLIFVSVIGGILTFCISEDELGVYRSHYVPRSAAAYSNRKSENEVWSGGWHSKPIPKQHGSSNFDFGVRVKTKIEIDTPQATIPAGSTGVISMPNSRGEPEVKFDGSGIKARVLEENLEPIIDEEKQAK